MICLNCKKLAITPANKYCLSCSGSLSYKQYIICDACSTNQKKCCICLKNLSIINIDVTKIDGGRCNRCGK